MIINSNQKIKIAQIITRLDWGGSPDILRIICAHLDPERYDVTLIFGQSRHPSAKTRNFLKQFKGKAVFIPQLIRDINPIYDLWAFLRLLSIMRRDKFDIVHTHTAKAGVLGRLAARFSGCPVIMHTPHGHNFYGYFGRIFSAFIVLLEKRLALFSDMIIALTELEHRDLLKYEIAPEEKLMLINLGLELDKLGHCKESREESRVRLGIKPGDFAVGMISRLEPVKGPEYFVQAAKQVAGKLTNVTFIVTGDGSLRRKLERFVLEAGLKERFIFTGWLEDVSCIFSSLDILVQPSLNEAVGMVLIEAQAQGIPVIASRVGGIPEVVSDGSTGILVSPKNANELSGVILYLLKDKERRVNMSVAGMLWVGDRFKADVMVRKLSVLYQTLIHKRNV